MVVDINVFYTFNMGDNIRVNCIGGWQGQLDGGDHRGRWHHDVSLQLESLVINRPLLATFSSYSTFMMSWTLVLSNTLKLSNTEMHSPSALLITSPSSLKNILIEVIHHDVTNLYGLLHLIILAIHSVVNHQPTCSLFRLSHWLKVRKLMSTTITAAFQIQVEENSNQSDTSGCQQPPWYSPSNCPCHPWCRWASTLVYLVWSNMLKV